MPAKYYHCPKCNLVIHESEVDGIEEGRPVHHPQAAGYDLPINHPVIPEP